VSTAGELKINQSPTVNFSAATNLRLVALILSDPQVVAVQMSASFNDGPHVKEEGTVTLNQFPSPKKLVNNDLHFRPFLH
jgi:hypothetical protein